MSKQDPATTIGTLMKRAKAKPVESPAQSADGRTDPIAELTLSFLMWEAPFTRARTAFKRVMDHAIDHNDLRVTRPEDLAGILGKTYPLALERCERLHTALEAVFAREYAVTLDNAMALGKRDGRKYLESIEDMPPYVAARTCLVAFGSHAVPLDDRTLARLIETGVFEDGTTIEVAQGVLERAVKATDALDFHQRMTDWMDKPAAAAGRKKTTKKAPASTRKKTSTKKTASGRKR
ncbi:MAG: hypothetical protein Tsb0013_02420 [Phycisphaerales bacterium]